MIGGRGCAWAMLLGTLSPFLLGAAEVAQLGTVTVEATALSRYRPETVTGGTSLLVRQSGLFSIRGMGGSEPAFDGVVPIGRGMGLFMDPSMLERVEVGLRGRF